MKEFPQSTIEEIIEKERLMLLTANQRYGQYYTHTLGCTVLLSGCITTVEHDRMMFGRFFSQMKKHHTLALFSTLRLHRVQSMMNLRQVLEAGAGAAFAIANPGQGHFVKKDQHGILDPSTELTKKRYAWLRKHYPDKSQWIKDKKDGINSSTAHANILSADSVFQLTDAGDQVKAPFFDIEDEYFVKADLWLIGSVALGLMDLLYGVNQDRNVIGFRADFTESVAERGKENDALLSEIKATDRFKRTQQKFGQPGVE